MWISNSGAQYSNTELIEILLQLDARCIVIQGPTGCGKTTLIKHACDTYPRAMAYCTVDQIVSACACGSFTLSESEHGTALWNNINDRAIIVIDDADLLSRHRACETEIVFRLSQITKHSLIILIGIEVCNRIPELLRMMNSTIIFDYKERKIEYEG